MHQERSTPAPLETDRGQQKDDNIDDLGHRPDGSEQDQPIHPERQGERQPGRDRDRDRPFGQ